MSNHQPDHSASIPLAAALAAMWEVYLEEHDVHCQELVLCEGILAFCPLGAFSHFVVSVTVFDTYLPG